MAESVARRAFAAGSEFLSRVPVLKHALKERLLDVIAQPWVQQREYRRWRRRHYPSAETLTALRQEAEALPVQPLIAVQFPSAPDRAAEASVTAQCYSRWVLGDDPAAEWVAYLGDARARLWPNALAEVVRRINADPTLDAIYTDEEDFGLHPLFKPEWNRELAESTDLLGGLVVVRSSVLTPAAAGHGRTQRILEEVDRVGRLPAVLVTAPAATADPVAVAQHLVAAGLQGADVQTTADPAVVEVSPALLGRPMVSIVIPSRNSLGIVRRCLESVAGLSTYDHYEIVLVDTGSDDPEVWAYYADFAALHKNFVVVPFGEKPFSYSLSCNLGAAKSKGEVLIFLNNDTEVITPEWMERLVAEAQRPGVAAVGPLLLFPGGRRIQHAGVGVGFGAVAANLLSGVAIKGPMTRTQHLLASCRRGTSAVTGACLAVRAEVFWSVGGFDPELRITFNDVDLCCAMGRLGYTNVYVPQVRLLHHESVSVNKLVAGRRDWVEVDAALDLMRRRWADLIADDPALNPNLDRGDARCRFAPKA
ncbi:MAG: glycosyltransferase family 2 protein [Propionibacteriaceae bacterium]|nr:glycosyltransferase family 2 protein [Micropruina sp.]HBX79846.1 hypothetical protein [Propionibacteriaceae bacterium]